MRLAGMAALAVAFAAPALAEDALRAGSYEIFYRLELPHIESHAEETTTVCLSGVGTRTALPVLSANNPMARCPAEAIRRDGSRLAFDIVCPGGNAAKASALFELEGDGFRGRIDMNMGGKNMTMTEVQRGRRLGDCPAPGAR